MLRINTSFCTFICAIVLTIANTILGQESSFLRKPWPTYSLQNMPQTRFTCHDKILGGYYADMEAQCQMFHICVKVAGVGVQDFRFLCPNGTAFDQEAQICADWNDVDCEQSVLYYGSDNFDLYRLGSGFESKRAPAAEEDESTFHLQRAESGDIRRFKETRVDQKSRPDQPPNYTKHFETVTRGTFNGNNNNNNNNHNYNVNKQQITKTKKKQQQQQTEITKKPIVSYYTPTSTTTTARTTTTERNYNDDSKQDLDDIFKGSHSSHFFSNRNGGREDDFLDHPVKPNDFSDFSKKSEATTSGKSRVTPTRSKRPPTQTTSILASSTTTAAPKTPKKVTQHSYYNTDFYDYTQYKSTASASNSSPTTTATTPRAAQGQSNANRFNIAFNNDYQTQAKIQPTTYNPNRYKPTTTKYTEFTKDKVDNDYYPKSSTTGNKKSTQTKGNSQNSTFVKFNEFNEFVKIKPQPPQPFQPQPPAKVFEAPARTSIEPQYYRSRGQPQARLNNQQPEPFRAPQRQTAKPTEKVKEKPTVNAETKPRGFVSRGSINYKATTQRDGGDSYPTTTANNHKKFSTLVPKDKYAPTTFKPSTYKKTYDNNNNNNNNYYSSQQTLRPQQPSHKLHSSTITSTTPYTTANPYYNIDEDDGQYHPELYEIDYSRSNFNRHRHTTTTSSSTSTISTTTQKPFKYNQQNPATHLKSQQQTSYLKEQAAAAAADFSDEDELFKTAQSLNFGAASINKLRADIYKAEKTSQQYNSQYNPHNTITSPKTTTTSTTPSSYTTTTTYFTYPSYSTSTQQTTPRPSTAFSIPTTTTTTTTTTRRPTTTTTTTNTIKYTTPNPFNITKSGKHAAKSEKKSKKNDNKNKKKTSKRPPHADEDTSYDYAYYDSDTLSESPQEYPEYEIQEFTKTKRN